LIRFPELKKSVLLHPQINMLKKLILPAIFLLFVTGINAQQTGEFGPLGGVSYYNGELNPGMPFRMSKFAYGALYRQNFTDRLAARVHVIRGTLTADDAVTGVRPDRNLNFTSPLTEIAGQLEVNFFEYYIGSYQHRWSPFIFGGGAFFMFKPYAMLGGSKTELRSLGTEGQGSAQYPDRQAYNLYSFAIPFGMGVKFSVNKYIGLSAEWGMRRTYTDYIDDISKTYYLNLAGADPASVSTPEYLSDPTLSHNTGMQRGNERNKDWYGFAGISATVKIRMLNRERCLDHQRDGY